MFLLLFIVFFVLASEGTSFIISMILRSIFRKSDDDIMRDNELRKMKQELNGMSRPDNFAAYSRLERRFNKLKAQIKDSNSNRIETMNSFSIVINVLVNVIWMAVSFFLILRNLYTPVIILDENWLYPFYFVFSWPSFQTGWIGLLFWYLVVKQTMNTIKYCFF